jgi:hypothetical protein
MQGVLAFAFKLSTQNILNQILIYLSYPLFVFHYFWLFMSLPSVAQATGAEIHYHPGVFTKGKIAIVVIVGLVGVTKLVIGILALLNVMPLGYGLPLLVGGAAFILLDVAGIAALAHFHAKTKKCLNEYIANERSDWWKKQFEQAIPIQGNEKKVAKVNEAYQSNIIGSVIFNDGGKKEIHIFGKCYEARDFHDKLIDQKNFTSCQTVIHDV